MTIIDTKAIHCSNIRAQGAGGQKVNKTASAIHLRYDFMNAENLSDIQKQKLLEWADSRINKDGSIIIKAQQYRQQKLNYQHAVDRLEELLIQALQKSKKRIATKPSKAVKKRRLDTKKQRSQLKTMRNKNLF